MENHEGEKTPVEGQEQSVNVESLVNELEKLKQTNERLLSESKENKTKYRALRDEVEQKQHKRLEEDEKWKELLDISKNENHQLKEQLNSLKTNTLKKAVQFEVAKYAKDAYDINDIISNLPSDKVKIDDENLSVSGIDEAVSLLKEAKPYLFQQEAPARMVGNRPKAGDMKEKPFNELSAKEQDEQLIELLKNM